MVRIGYFTVITLFEALSAGFIHLHITPIDASMVQVRTGLVRFRLGIHKQTEDEKLKIIIVSVSDDTHRGSSCWSSSSICIFLFFRSSLFEYRDVQATLLYAEGAGSSLSHYQLLGNLRSEKLGTDHQMKKQRYGRRRQTKSQCNKTRSSFFVTTWLALCSADTQSILPLKCLHSQLP